MTSDPSIARRVSRLENDTAAIYELLAELKSTQDEHSRRFDSVDARFDSVDARFRGLDTRLGGLEESMAEVLRRLPG